MESRKILKFFVFLTLFGINLAQIERNCYSCNSTENFYCQSNPEKLDKSVYTCQGKICNEINVDGAIIKGCTGRTLEGLICNNKDYCNENTHQFDCIQCDSTNNPSCKNNVSSITTTCKSLMCYTLSDAAGNILRGCTESSELKTLNSCNNAEKCNNADYNSCYECKGTACLEPLPTTPTCQTDQKCFTKLQADGSIERGCSTNLTCNNGECEECSGENCNTVILPKDRLRCLQCNGTTECNNGDISLGKYCSKVETNDKCFAYADASGLMYRGCLSDDVDKKCDSSNCETCDSENCNNWKFTDRPSKLSCYKCENCSSIEESLEPVSCGSYSFNEQEKCYTFVNNATKTVERGCYLGTKDIETKCGSGQCTTCSEDKCNNKSVISCYDCLDCLTTTNSTPTSLCTVGEMCISRILGESQVFRGCSAKKCQDGEICKDCKDDKCNDGVFPEDRLTCMQCDSESESDECSKGLGAKKLCTKYKKDDKCFQLVNENNLIKRGCLSDIENTNITCNDKTHCKECSRENCNDISLKITAHISCVQCQNCTTNLPKSEKCSYELFYYEEAEEKCYVQNVTESNTTVTNRGCLFDLPGKECQENCETCGVDGCNQYGPDYKEYPDFQCYICHGKDCTGKVEKCSPIPTSENGGPGCFVERRKDFIIRDCISNADKWNSTLTGKYVYKCIDDSCNDGAAPGSAIALQLSSSMLIAFVALVFLL